MPESMNVEFAHKLGEQEHEETTKRRDHWETFMEVIEVFVLAVVGGDRLGRVRRGYQWDGRRPSSTARRPPPIPGGRSPPPLAARNYGNVGLPLRGSKRTRTN